MSRRLISKLALNRLATIATQSPRLKPGDSRPWDRLPASTKSVYRSFRSAAGQKMPRQALTYPPPARPADDDDALELRSLALLCNHYYAMVRENPQSAIPAGDSNTTDRVIKILGQFQSKEQNKAWALYDSHTLQDLTGRLEGDLTYFKGDVIQILDGKGRWVLGVCRGRMGITCIDHLDYDNFFRALYDYTPTQPDEVGFSTGQVFPAIPSCHAGWLYGFLPDEEGHVPENHVEPAKTRFAERIGPDCYQYKPLKPGEIRLIRISDTDVQQTHARGGDTTFFSLVTVRLDEAPAYTALSYCWGDASLMDTVLCDQQPLRVSQNLANLLKWFVGKPSASASPRSPEHQYIWADAICIDQSNDVEKAHQIPLMRTIYGTARNVRVYLGESDDVWKVLANLAMVDQLLTNTSAVFAPQTSAQAQEVLGKMDIAALLKLFRNPAFHRSWMIQEMVLGKDVTLWYGQVQMDLEQIRRYIYFQDGSDMRFASGRHIELTPEQIQDVTLGTYHADNLGKIRLAWQQGRQKSFIEVLRRFRGAKATDLRDKVYSLLSLSQDHYLEAIVPDYSASNTTADVFMHVASLAVTSPDKQDVVLLLQNAGLHLAESTVGHQLPSWVPDWTLLPCYPIDPAFYQCCGNTSANVHTPSDSSPAREILVKGAIIDRIGYLGPVWSNRDDQQPLPGIDFVTDVTAASIMVHETLYQLCRQLAEAGRAYPVPNVTYEDATWQTLTCGRGWGQRRATLEDKAYYEAFLRNVGIKGSSDGVAAADAQSKPNDHPFYLVLEQFQRGRRVGMTSKGYLGSFGNQTGSGDVVALLFGFNTPFVLRPWLGRDLAGGKRYQLVGPCYVHGIMDGELVSVRVRNGLEEVVVRGGEVEELLIV